MDYEGLIDDNRVLIACSMNYETAVTFTYGHFNKAVFAVYMYMVFGSLFCSDKYIPMCELILNLGFSISFHLYIVT